MKPKLWKKLMACILAGCFSIETALYADIGTLPGPVLTDVSRPENFLLDRKFFQSFPHDAGKIQKIFQGTGPQLLIHIQDAHMNESAQRHLAELLDYLAAQKNVRQVYVEGAEGRIAHGFLSAYPDAETRRQTAEFFLKQGMLHGAEYAAVRFRPDLVLEGVEEMDLYEENRRVYLEGLTYKDRNARFLKQMRSLMDTLGRYVLPSTYRTWQKLKKQVRDGQDLPSYIEFLNREKKRAGIGVSYPALEAFEEILRLEKEFDRRQAQKEWADFFKDSPAGPEVKALYEKDDGSNEIFPAVLAKNYLSSLTGREADYPELTKLTRLSKLYLLLENGLWDETEKLEKDLKSVWLRDKQSLRLDRLFDFLQVYESIFEFALTKTEAEFFYAHRSEFRPETFTQILMPLLVSARHQARWDERAWKRLHDDLTRIEQFYALALKRDDVLVQNTIEKMKQNRAEVSVLITGGFHTPGIESELKKQGISYAVMTPKIDGFNHDFQEKEKYASALRAEKIFWGKTQKPAVSKGFINDVRFQLEPPYHFPAVQQLRSIPANVYGDSALPALIAQYPFLEFPAIGMIVTGLNGIRRQKSVPADYPQQMKPALLPEERGFANQVYGLLHSPESHLQVVSEKQGRYLSPQPQNKGWAGIGAFWQTARNKEDAIKSHGQRQIRLTMGDGVQFQIEFPADASEYRAADARFQKTKKRKKSLIDSQPVAAKRSEIRRVAPAAPETVIEIKKEIPVVSLINGRDLALTAVAMLFIHAFAPLTWGNFFLSLALFRLGIAFKKLMNEWGHISAASFRFSGIHTWKNLMGNRSFGEWLGETFLFLKTREASVFVPQIKMEYGRLTSADEIPDREAKLKKLLRQDKQIRRGGFGMGVIFAFLPLGLAISLNPAAGTLLFPLLAGAFIGLVIAFVSDFLNPAKAGKYDCGVIVCIEPVTTPAYVVLNRLFEVIRTLDPRGGQAFGIFVVGSLRLFFGLINWITFSLSTGFMAFAGLAALLSSYSLLPAALSFLPFNAFIYSGLFSLGSLILLTLSGTTGEAGFRVRVMNPKRADLATTSLTATIRVWMFSLFLIGKKSVRAFIAHVRFSTSAPDARGTQPHIWRALNWFSLLFSREWTLELKNGEFVWKKNWTDVTVTHNGDNNGYYFRKFKMFVAYSGGVLHRLWSTILDWTNKDKGDTVNLSGLMKFFAAQKSFKASIRLAYFQIVMNSFEPSEKLTKRELKVLTRRFEKAFMKNQPWAQAWVREYLKANDLDPAHFDMADLPTEFLVELTKRLVQDIPRDDLMRSKIPDEQWENFVLVTLTHFFRADLFYATWQMAVKNIEESEKPDSEMKPAPFFMDPMGEANGTFGLGLLSPKFNEAVFYRYVNPFSVVFDENFTRVMGGSERVVFNVKPYRYRFDMRDGEIMRVKWDDNGKLSFRVFSVPEGRYLTEEEVRDSSRMIDMEKNPDVAKRPDPKLKNIVRQNIEKIAKETDSLIRGMKNEQSANAAAVNHLAEAFLRLAESEKAGNPRATEVLITGTESSKQLGELLYKQLHIVFPSLNIRTAYQDDIATSAVDYVNYPEEFAKDYGITKDTLVLGVSQSGRTFEAVGTIKWLGTFVNDIFAFTGDRDNEISDYLGQGRIISTDTGGIQLAEPRTHVNAAFHTVMNETFMKISDVIIRQYPEAFGNIMTPEHLKMLREDGEVRRDRIESITGINKRGQKVYSRLNHFIEREGNRRAQDALEGIIVLALTSLIYALSVYFVWPIFPSSFVPVFLSALAEYGFISAGAALPAALFIPLDTGFVYFFGRVVVTRIWRLGQNMLYKAGKLAGLELPFGGRLLRYRSTTPKLLIAENEIYAPLQELTFSKMVALGYKNAPFVDSASVNQLNHFKAHKAARGDTILSAQPRQPTRRGGSVMSPQQTRGNLSLGVSVYVITIGHNLTKNRDAFHEFIELEDGTAKDFFAVPGAQGVKLTLLQEYMYDSFERSLAEYVFINGYSESLSFPWFTRIPLNLVNWIPVIKQILHFIKLRFPFLFLYFPRHRTHDGTGVDTTASPTDLTALYAKIEEFEKKASGIVASGKRLRTVSHRDLPNRVKLPAVKIPAGVYEKDLETVPAAAFEAAYFDDTALPAVTPVPVQAEKSATAKPAVSDPVKKTPPAAVSPAEETTRPANHARILSIYRERWTVLLRELKQNADFYYEDEAAGILDWKEDLMDRVQRLGMRNFSVMLADEFKQIEDEILPYIMEIINRRHAAHLGSANGSPHNGNDKSPVNGEAKGAKPDTAGRSEVRIAVPEKMVQAIGAVQALKDEVALRSETRLAGDLERAGAQVLALMENFTSIEPVRTILPVKPGTGNGAIIFNYRSELRDIHSMKSFIERVRKEAPRTPVLIYRDPQTSEEDWDALQAAVKPSRLIKYYDQERFETLPAFIAYQQQMDGNGVIQLRLPAARLKKQFSDWLRRFERGAIPLVKNANLVVGYDQSLKGVRELYFEQVFAELVQARAQTEAAHQSA